jgi:hypothetical protein
MVGRDGRLVAALVLSFVATALPACGGKGEQAATTESPTAGRPGGDAGGSSGGGGGTDAHGSGEAGTGDEPATGGQPAMGGQDTGGADTGGESPVERIFSYGFSIRPLNRPVPCRGPEDCQGERCVELTKELSVCEAPLLEATECSAKADAPVADECGCDGLTCGPGEICRARELTCSCVPNTVNVCVEEPCRTPSDCADGTVCVPRQFILGGRCLTAQCTADADCDYRPSGVCGLEVSLPSQAGELSLTALRCFYDGGK